MELNDQANQSMSKSISENSTVVVSKELVFGEILDGEVAILNLKDSVYYGLNEIASRIWDLIQEPRIVSEIRDVLLKEYDVDKDVCTRELLALLEELAAKDLIIAK